MLKICLALLLLGGLVTFVGWNAGSQSMIFLGVLSVFVGGAGLDRTMRVW